MPRDKRGAEKAYELYERVFEIPPFDRGTRAVAEAVVQSQAFSIAGSGASLEFLETGDLPGIAVPRG
jgi:3-phosphoglycerate kinase